MSEPLADCAFVAGRPACQGLLRETAEDFVVSEDLGFAASGEGEHVLLRVRKRGANTGWVAERLARIAGVARKAVSYAGMKDRHAVAEQWFSVHLPGAGEPDWSSIAEPEFTVLAHSRHSRKLKRGALRGNRFDLTLRELKGPPEDLIVRLERVSLQGAPNYFGPQRFGRDGSNLERARNLFAGRLKVRDRERRGLYLSAARAALFNAAASQRVAQGTWNRACAGDVMMLDGSRSVFAVTEPDSEIDRRVAQADIHPSGPLWGRGELMVSGDIEALERAVAGQMAAFAEGLEAAGLKQERRALRVLPKDVSSELGGDGVSAKISFYLPAGSYATAILRELMHTVEASP